MKCNSSFPVQRFQSQCLEASSCGCCVVLSSSSQRCVSGVLGLRCQSSLLTLCPTPPRWAVPDSLCDPVIQVHRSPQLPSNMADISFPAQGPAGTVAASTKVVMRDARLWAWCAVR